MALLDRLTLLIDADGSRAVGELDRLGRKTKETLTVGQQFGRDFFKGLGVGAGAVSGYAAADALKQLAHFSIQAAQAAEEDNRSQFVLAKTLQATTDATLNQVQGVEAFISRTSAAAGVVDDELRPAMATLARSTNDVATAQRLLSLALDISAGTGRDVGTVSQGLAKAWEGQTTALGRLIPEVGGLIREGASGAEVFNRLQRTFGGTAEEAAKQAGSFRSLKVSADQLTETYGRGLLPAVNGVSIAVAHLSEATSKPMGGGLFTLAQAANPLNQALGVIGAFGGESIKLKVETEAAAQGMKILATRLDGVADAGGTFSNALRHMGFGTINFRDSLAITTSTLLGFEASVHAAASAASGFLSDIFSVGSAEDKFANAIDDTTASTGGATKATRDLIAEQFNLERSARTVLQAELDLLDAEKNLEEVRKGASDREKKRAALDVSTAQGRVQQAEQRIVDATNELNRASGRRGSSAEAARARQALADAILDEERARMDLTDTEERANETQTRGTAGSKDLADATKKVEDAQWALKEAIESQRQSAMQDQEDGGPVGRSARQQRASFREAAQAAVEVAESLVKSHVPSDVLTAKIGAMVAELKRAGEAAGMTREEIQAAADELIVLGVIFQAEQARSLSSIYGFGATSLVDELDAMRRQGIYVPDIAYRKAGGRAGGGSVNAGRSYTVGENGIETLHMGNSPGWITPAGGGAAVNFHFGTVVADRANLERILFEALDSARRRGWN